MRMIVEQDREVVAIVDDYDGPIPRVNEYILHPPQDATAYKDWSKGRGGLFDVAGCVQSVEYGIYARPQKLTTEHFVKTHHPFVKVILG